MFLQECGRTCGTEHSSRSSGCKQCSSAAVLLMFVSCCICACIDFRHVRPHCDLFQLTLPPCVNVLGRFSIGLHF